MFAPRTNGDRSACFYMYFQLVAAGPIWIRVDRLSKVRLVPILVPNPTLASSVQPSQTRYSITSFYPQCITPASVYQGHARRCVLFHAAPTCACFYTTPLIWHAAVLPSPHVPFWHCSTCPGVPALPIIGFFFFLSGLCNRMVSQARTTTVNCASRATGRRSSIHRSAFTVGLRRSIDTTVHHGRHPACIYLPFVVRFHRIFPHHIFSFFSSGIKNADLLTDAANFVVCSYVTRPVVRLSHWRIIVVVFIFCQCQQLINLFCPCLSQSFVAPQFSVSDVRFL